jgi:hypothetical protein
MRITIETDQAPNIVHGTGSGSAGASSTGTGGAMDAGASGAPRNMTAGAQSDASSGSAMDAGAPHQELVEQVERARLMETGQGGGASSDFAGAEDAGAGPRTIQ